MQEGKANGPDQLVVELEERLKLTYDAVNEGVWDWDIRNDGLVWSDRFLDLVGVDRADFIPKVDTFFDRLHPDDKEAVRAALTDHVENGAPYDIRYLIRHEAGHYIPVRALGQTLRSDDGTPLRMVGSVQDISDQVATKQALDESEIRFKQLADNIPGAIFRYLICPDGSDEIEYMSPGCLEIWEVDAETIQGDPTLLWEAVVEEDFPAMRESVMLSAETLTPWSHKWRIETRSGIKKWLHGRGQPSRLDDGSILFNSLILDITEQTQNERDLADSREMVLRAQKMDSLGQLTGGMAHDFNNLLGIILGNIELLNDLAPIGEFQRYVNNALKAVQRGSELTRSLLAFARRATLEPAPVDVEDVVADLRQMLSHTLPENIEFTTNIEPGLPRIFLDRGAFESTLLNLVINSRDAISEQGRITLTFSSSQIAAQSKPGLPAGNYVEVCVEDNGSGIDDELLQRITEPFFTTKEVGKGTGLGLSIVDGFVRQSGGLMQIHSTPGQGTRITLLFPEAETEPGVKKMDGEQSSDTTYVRQGTILVVEDEEDLRTVLCNRLTAEGYTVIEAANGAEALAQYEQLAESLDLLLTDFILPGELQGPDIAVKLKEQQPGLPVVYVSGYVDVSDPHNEDEYLRADARLYKPVGKIDLLKTIRQVLTRRDLSNSHVSAAQQI